MKNTLKLITLLLICFYVQSCQKNPVTDPLTPPIKPPLDSVTVLSQAIYIDLSVSVTDTVAYETYSYDSLQRITTIDFRDFIDTYYYKGSDSLAYKMTEISLDPQFPSPYTVWYFYDNLQRLLKDSISSDVVNYYSYSATMITAFRKGLDQQSNPLTNADTGFIASTGDIIKTNEKDDYFDGTTYSYTVSYGYDNKRNPFYEMNIHSTYDPVPAGDFFIDGFYLQKNNTLVATYREPSSPGITNSSIYTYTYNSLNFPATLDVVYDGGSVDDRRIIFIYKKI